MTKSRSRLKRVMIVFGTGQGRQKFDRLLTPSVVFVAIFETFRSNAWGTELIRVEWHPPEASFMVLDGTMVTIACFALTVSNPGRGVG